MPFDKSKLTEREVQIYDVLVNAKTITRNEIASKVFNLSSKWPRNDPTSARGYVTTALRCIRRIDGASISEDRRDENNPTWKYHGSSSGAAEDEETLSSCIEVTIKIDYEDQRIGFLQWESKTREANFSAYSSAPLTAGQIEYIHNIIQKLNKTF